ncbi:PE family protein [Mycobacterium heidelbergense]|uniref:PE family protein n=1 Tax=Mycobacterium heidelbergense TaxID=53376 RepID=UPI003CEBF45B
MDHGELSIRPGEVSDANGQLAVLADRVKQVMDAEALNLTVDAPGRDEVSQRVAATLNQVHEAFGKSSDQGQQQLRELSTTLQANIGKLVAADEGQAV